MKRISIFPALILCGIFALQCSAQSENRPNIVVILVDDMGWSDIATYGGEIPTPNLDALARNGVRFTQFYNTARCSPTRASLLTGHYPHQAGMGHLDNLVRQDSLGYQGKISDRSVTMAEVLKASGYFTAMTGKWHLGQQNGTPPWKRGFDRSLNIRAGGIFFPGQTGNPNDPLSSRAKEPLYLNGAELPQTAPEFGQDWYSTYLWTDFGLKFIDEALKEKKPFFLYLAHNAPHFPLMAPRELIAKYKGKYMAGWDRLREERYRRQLKMGLIDPKWPLSPRAADTAAWDSLPQSEKERYDQMMAVYAAMVEAIDRSVGSLVKGLKDRRALDNTLIFFLSDNGGNGEAGPKGRSEGAELGSRNSTVYLGMNWAGLNNTPFRRFKHFTHEGGVSTPLIAHWPAGIPRARNGKLEHQPGHVIDLMATVVEVTAARNIRPSRAAGRSIRWKAFHCAPLSTADRSSGQSRSFSSTKGIARSASANGNSSRSTWTGGNFTIWKPTARNSTTSRSGSPRSSKTCRRAGRRGRSEPIPTSGRGRAATTGAKFRGRGIKTDSFQK